MTFAELIAWAHARLVLCATAIETSGAPRPNVYRWWEPGMSLPAAYLWMQRGGPTAVVDSCTVRDDVRLVFSFATRPTRHEGEDMLTIEQVVAASLPIIDSACLSLARQAGMRSRPVREGFAPVEDRMAGEGTERALVLEVPVLIPWHQHVEQETAL